MIFIIILKIFDRSWQYKSLVQVLYIEIKGMEKNKLEILEYRNPLGAA